MQPAACRGVCRGCPAQAQVGTSRPGRAGRHAGRAARARTHLQEPLHICRLLVGHRHAAAAVRRTRDRLLLADLHLQGRGRGGRLR